MSKKETLTNNGNTPKTITPPKANIADDFIQGQYAASSDILGGSGAYTATYGNTDFGESKYDNPDLGNTFIESGDYKYTRGAMQSTAEKWGIGLSRAALKLGTRTLNGIVSPVYGIGSAIKNWDINKIVDNDVTRANQEFEAKIDKEMPLYSTKAAEDAKGLGKLAYANTWAGSILDGISYSGAAMLSGGVYTKALSAASKLASLDKLGMTVAEAMGAATKIEDAADKTKFVIDLTNKAKQLKNGLNNGTIALIGASTEASSEAMSTGDEFEKQMLAKIEQEEGGISDVARARVSELKKSVMNSTYALQIPVIAGSNWLTFGKTMLGSTATEKLLAKTAARTDREAIGESYKASVTPFLQKIIDKTYGLRQVTGKAIPEGFEEWEQFAVTKGVNDYYANKYYNATYDDFFSSMAKGVNDAMSEEGLENFIIGAVSGGIFGNATQIKTEGFKSYKNPINEKSINETLDYLNSIKGSDAFKSQVQMQYRHANLSEKYDKSVDANNDFEINNNKSDMFINYVNHMVNAGKTQDLREELESYKNLSNQEFEEVLGIKLSNDALTNTKESVNSYIQKRLDKIDKIEQLSNTLDNLHPNLSSNIKDRFMYTAWTLEDAQDRVKNLTKEVGFKLGDNLTTANVVAVNILQDFPTLDKEARQNALAAINSNLQISPLLKEEILKKVNDLDKLVDRQNQFIAEYKALENPKLQALLEAKDELVENQVSKVVNENETKEDTKDTTINPLDPNDPNNANPPAPGQQPVPAPAATVDPSNPLAQWFATNKMDYNTSEKDLTDALNRDTTISAEDKGKIFADWTYNQGKQPVVTQTQAQPTPDQVLKDPKRPQSFLMTQTKDRDTALQSDKKVIGNFRGTNEDGTPKYGIPVNGQPVALATFAEVQGKLKELIDAKENLNDHINFEVTDTGYVLVLIDDMPVSIVDKGLQFKGTPEQEKAFFEIRHLFYNQNAKARTIQELNVNKALINFTANSLLNFTTNNEDTQTTLETLQQENPQIPFVLKIGANMLDPLNTDTDIYYDEESKGQTISSNESIANIQDGLHLEITENSYPQLPIKVRIAPHANLQEELDKVNSATTPEEKIAAVKAFNKEVFIALKPVEGVNRKISLFYDTKADIFALQVEEKTSGSKWGGETTKKTAEIILPNVSTESILEGLNARQINGKDARALVESDIKYNNYIDEDNQIIPSRLSTPIGKEGLFKYDLQAQIVDNAVPVTSTVVTSTPVQQTPVQTSTTTTTPTDLEALKQTPEGKKIEEEREKALKEEEYRTVIKTEDYTGTLGDNSATIRVTTFKDGSKSITLLDENGVKIEVLDTLKGNRLSIGLDKFIDNPILVKDSTKEYKDSDNKIVNKINAKYDAELEALEPTTTTTDIEAKRADIENTLYRTISGSRPLSEMIEDGMYIDLGNNMFAYVGKNGIAAIVNKDITDNKGNYSASKSFWNTKEKKWVLPNLSNLKDDAKVYKLDEKSYIEKFEKATDKLNTELVALEGAPTTTDIKKADIEITNDTSDRSFVNPSKVKDLSEIHKSKITSTSYRNGFIFKIINNQIEFTGTIDFENGNFAPIKGVISNTIAKDYIDAISERNKAIEEWNKLGMTYGKSDYLKGVDALVAVKRRELSEKILNKLKESAELKALEGTTKTNEEKIADLRADEQAELLKAIPNIAEFLQSNFMGKGTTYGENQGNMPDNLYAIYKPIYDKYNALITKISENKPTETSTVNTEDEADFATMNNNTAFVGKVKEDLINKWNQKLGTNFPVKPKSKELSLFKSAVESYLNKNNPNRSKDNVYSIGLEESTGITQQEIDSIKAILPKFISIEDIKTIAQNLKIKGIPYGAFKNKVIYLNTSKGKPGAAYHEAFHAVFRTMLTDAQIEKYLMASAKDFVKSGKNMQEEVNKLRETVADYLTKSDLELQTIVLEEHMADKFQSFAENKVGRETEPLLRQLFIKIKEFFKQLFRMGNELDMFYSNILKGAFVNATPISNVYTNSSDTVFKLLPNKFTATDNGFFTAQESRKIINSFAIDVYKFKTGKYGKIEELTNKSDEQILDYFINKRISDLENKGRDYADSFLDTNEVKANEINSGIDKELYLYDKENKNSSEINGYEVLTSSVLEKLKVFNFKNSSEDITEQEGGDENQEIKEKFGSQDAWLSGGHDSLSQTIKKYASFTTKTEVDSLTGENREVAIDDVTLYNGLTRILADTAEENMIAKLHYASESNPNVKAFYEQMIKDLGVTFNPEDGTITTPNNSNNYNIYRAFLSNFKKSRVSQIDILLGKTGLTWGNANQNDPAKVSLNQWENNLLVASVKDKASVIAAADRIFAEANDFIKPKKDNAPALEKKVETLKKEFAKIGINVTTAYIRFSLLKQKSLLKSVQENPSAYLTKDQITFLSNYKVEIPINFGTFAPESANLKTYSIAKKLKTSSNPIDIYKKDEGLSELKSIAENNALFDESIGNFSFTNAEGERVYEIINKSYVLEAISKFKDGTYLERLINGTAVGLNETETKNNYFLKNNLLVNKYQDYLKDLKLNILSGIRDTNPGTNNQSKAGITFGKFDGRSYLISALTLFNNNGNKESGKYIFRQNEASNTAYVAELPKLALIGKNTMDDKTINDYFGRQFLNEFERIGREKKLFDAGKGTQYEKYNTALTDRAFDFTEFQYLKDIMGEAKYQELVDAALNSTPGVPGLTDVQMAEVLGAINTYINIGFSDFLKLVDSYGLKFVDNISKEMLSDENLKNFYINDYIMSSSMNELLDGDYALSRKSKVDISKRNKSAMASGVDYGKGNHNCAIIKDIFTYLTLNPKTNVLERVTKQGDKYFNDKNVEIPSSEVKEITSNNAQSYASQYHLMMGSLRMGRLDEKTKEIYKNIIQFTKRNEKGKVVRNVNIGNKNQSHLSDALASLNSKKTVAFDGVNALILKMSEFGLVRSSISYIDDKDVDNFTNLTNQLTDLMFNKDDFESEEFRNIIAQIAKLYKPVPGMEYWHKLANNMDKHGVDHAATQEASKGATTLAEDSLSDDFDLSKSRFKVANNTKRLQVETPTGKKEIVFGSQILTIITSELNDDAPVPFLVEGKKVNVGQLRSIYNNAINDARNSEFTKAIAVIKDLKGKALSPNSTYEGMIDTTELDEIVKRALAASGADVQQMQYFEGGYNYNMIQMLVKAEQVILAHFSKGVLNQKVNGDKVSLLAGSGITVVRDIKTGNVISHHEVVKNPSKYTDKSKYSTNTTLRYNVTDKDGKKYSECILSQAILTRHGLKVGDMITEKHEEILKMFGYRIPTGDKQSAMSLKVVSLLPDYYNGVGIFPDEIVYLSGADFDIDSEFIQMPAFWINSKGEPVKFGTEKTNAEKFEAYKYYNKKYDKNFKAVLNNILSKDSRLTAVLNDKDLEQDQISAIKSVVFDEAYKEASIKLGLPYTETDFIKSGLQPTANYNNTAVDAMISILTNESLNEITNNTTSTDALKAVAKNLIDGGFIKQTKGKIQEKNKSAHDINGKFDANKKNSDGKNGIGIAANKIQQFAFLMSKIGEKKVKFNDESFKFEIAGQVGGTYQQENKEGQRIADNLNLLLNAFTDNAKDPIAGRLNLKFELLGGAMELIMQGMTFENTMKLINLPIIQEYGELAKTLKYAIKTDVESKFSKESIKIAAIAKILYPEEAKKSLKAAMDKVKEAKQYKAPDLNPISEKDIENILLDKEFQSSDANDFTNNNDVQLQALFQFLQVVDQNNVMSNINTFLKLNQGLDVSFTDLHDDLHKAIDTFQINNLVGAPSENLEVPSKPHINITKLLEEDKNTLNNIKRALVVERQVGQKIFIEQTKVFKNEFQKFFKSLNPSFIKTGDNLAKLSREFLGFLSVKSYISDLEKLKNDLNTPESDKEAINKRLKSINLGLVFNELNAEDKKTLAQQLIALKANPATRNNYIVNYFSAKINDVNLQPEDQSTYEADIIDTKSFVKESNETISLLIDSVKSLYSDSRTKIDETGLTPRDFVDNMLGYLMVKDNMTFKNNSVAKYLPVEMFGNYSKSLDNIIEALVTKSDKLSVKLDELGYNFRKLYAADLNSPWGTLQFMQVENNGSSITISENKEEITFKTKNDTALEIAKVKSKINKKEYSDEQGLADLQKQQTTLEKRLANEKSIIENKEVLDKLFDSSIIDEEGSYKDKEGKTVTYTKPAYIFPQFMTIRVGEKGESKTYELVGYSSDLSANKTVGMQQHNTNEGFATGESAVYRLVEKTGNKGVSIFSTGTYDNAVSIFSKVTKKTPVQREIDELSSSNIAPDSFESIESMQQKELEKAGGQTIAPVTQEAKKATINPYALTEDLENEISGESANVTEENVVDLTKKPLINEEKNVILENGKAALLDIVAKETLYLGGVEFSPNQYAQLSARINNATTIAELQELEDNINKCM